ncbi:MAG: hypothetical protein JWP40_156 [Blastococcus sp.]|nr:hypothetical protein [Blastococcus sp.]
MTPAGERRHRGRITDERAALPRYEMRIRTVVSPALIASCPLRATRTEVRRRSTFLVRVTSDRDITDVVRRLVDRGVEILDIRSADVRSVDTRSHPRSTSPRRL